MPPRTTTQAVNLQPNEALAYFRQKVNVTSTHWADLMDKAHARGFMVAGAASEALVEDIRKEVDRAIASGTTLQTFQKAFDQIVAKHGWEHNGAPGWRAKIIYQTNLATAYSAGRYVQMTEPFTKEAFPYWQYVHNTCPHPRPQHVAWNGLILRCDDPWWDTHYPPNGWRCHCSIRMLSEHSLARMGRTGPDKAPPLDLYDWTNKKTGEVFKVPRGIDPGFAYNPGKAWVDAAGRPKIKPLETREVPVDANGRPIRAPEPPKAPASTPAPVKAGLGPVEVQPAEPGTVHPIPPPPEATQPTPRRPRKPRRAPRAQPPIQQPSPSVPATPLEFAQFLEKPQGSIILGRLPVPIETAARFRSADIELSAEAWGKQLAAHPEMTPAEYALMPAIVAKPSLVLDHGSGRLFLAQRGGIIYAALIRDAASTPRLANFHRLRAASLQRLLMHFTILYGSVRALHDDDGGNS